MEAENDMNKKYEDIRDFTDDYSDVDDTDIDYFYGLGKVDDIDEDSDYAFDCYCAVHEAEQEAYEAFLTTLDDDPDLR